MEKYKIFNRVIEEPSFIYELEKDLNNFIENKKILNISVVRKYEKGSFGSIVYFVDYIIKYEE